MSHAHLPSSARNDLWVCHLGLVPYREALVVQARIRARRQADEIPDTLLLLEHPPVYTIGRRAGAADLPLAPEHYRERGIDVLAVDRGGKITYHGPGQLVGYPIMRVGDVARHVRAMEAAIVAALAGEGVGARARAEEGPDYTGVWVAERKIASIGVHIQRGVSTHGFAVNVHNALDPFERVIACGLPDVVMTSLAAERERLGEEPGPGCGRELQCFRRRAAYEFCRVHGRRQRLVSAPALGIEELLPAGGPHPWKPAPARGEPRAAVAA